MNWLYFFRVILGRQEGESTKGPQASAASQPTVSIPSRSAPPTRMEHSLRSTNLYPYRPKPPVHSRIHSECCVSYRIWQTLNDIYPPWEYPTEQLHWPKGSSALLFHAEKKKTKPRCQPNQIRLLSFRGGPRAHLFRRGAQVCPSVSPIMKCHGCFLVNKCPFLFSRKHPPQKSKLSAPLLGYSFTPLQSILDFSPDRYL